MLARARVPVILVLSCAAAGSTARTVEATSSLTVVKVEPIATQFLLLNVLEYRLGDELRKSLVTGAVGAGAFCTIGNEIVYTSGNGRSLSIDLDRATAKTGRLPDLDLGAGDFVNAKHIRYFETNPRVHSLIERDGVFYATYDHFRKETDSIHFELARFRAGDRGWSVVFRSPALDVAHYTLGNGGAMLFVGRRLYFSIGDYALERVNHLPSDLAPQNSALPWGKVMAVDLDTHAVQMVSMGHRNVLGLVTLRDGRMLASEQGPRGGDKLAFITPGRNHGWPLVSGGADYGTFKPIGDRKTTSFEPPFFEFMPSVALTQIVELEHFDDLWDGDLLLGSLKAQSLYRVRLSAGRVLHTEQIALGHRLRDVKQIGSRIVVLGDDYSFLVLEADHDLMAQRRSLHADPTLHLCTACHDFGEHATAFAPSLRHLFGRPIAGSDFARYSPALKAAAGARKWDQDTLAAFVRSPDRFAPGTTMPNLHISEADVQRIVVGLRNLRDEP